MRAQARGQEAPQEEGPRKSATPRRASDANTQASPPPPLYPPHPPPPPPPPPPHKEPQSSPVRAGGLPASFYADGATRMPQPRRTVHPSSHPPPHPPPPPVYSMNALASLTGDSALRPAPTASAHQGIPKDARPSPPPPHGARIAAHFGDCATLPGAASRSRRSLVPRLFGRAAAIRARPPTTPLAWRLDPSSPPDTSTAPPPATRSSELTPHPVEVNPPTHPPPPPVTPQASRLDPGGGTRTPPPFRNYRHRSWLLRG